MENKKEKTKLKIFILFLIVFSIVFLIMTFTNFIDISILYDFEENGIHFDLITVNSIFSGFLFSSLSLIVGFNSTSLINSLEKAGFMSNIYFNLVFGIVCSLISIISSLIMLFGGILIKNNDMLHEIVIPSLELLFLLFTIIVFIKAVIDVSFIIRSIRKITNKKYENDDIEETIRQIK